MNPVTRESNPLSSLESMSHDSTEQTIEPTDVGGPESDPVPQPIKVTFYVLAVVLTAGNATLVGLGTDGFWLIEATLLPLAFLLCLAGPNGPLRMGLAMILGMILGWIVINPIAAFAMLFIGSSLCWRMLLRSSRGVARITGPEGRYRWAQTAGSAVSEDP